MIKQIMKHFEVYLFILLLTVGFILYQNYIVDKCAIKVVISKDKLTEFDTISIDILTEMNKLLTAFSTLLFGTVGAFAFKNNRFKKGIIFSRILMMLVYISAGISIYSGYVLYNNIINQLSNNAFNSNDKSIMLPQKAQFYSFIIAVVILFINIATYQEKEGENDN